MATKDQKIKSLELENIDLGEKLNGITEFAADLLLGLALAVDQINEQEAILEIDALMLGVADEVIVQQGERINELERAERRRERAEADKQREQDTLDRLKSKPAMANWALVNTKTLVDGMMLATEPSRYDRRRNVVVEIDRNGQDAKTTATTTGAATVSFDMPVFGRQSARATIEHVETSDTPTSKDVMVRNTITFTFRIGDANRTIKIVSGGKIQRGCGWYVGEEYTQVLVGSDVYYSSYYEEYRGSDAKDAAIETAPMTERRSGGCGGW